MSWRGPSYTYLAIGLSSWLVACGDDGGGVTPPASSDLQIIVATSGSPPDPDGYTITLDGTERGTLGANGTLTLTELTPGSHLVGLTGLAPNCQVEGDNPQAVTVPEEGSATATFAVTCTTPAPTVGIVQVTTATTGSDLDPDGYVVALDGNPGLPIAANTSRTLPDVPAGTHAVTLSGVATNCQVQGENPRAVSVPGGGSVTVDFAITCTTPVPAAGVIRVSTATTGSDQDDGYLAALDGNPAVPIGPNASITLSNVPAGNHTVALSGIASNCTVSGGASRNVPVTAGATSDVSFAIACTATGPSQLEKFAGDNQTGPPGSALSNPLVVRVLDAAGDPVNGVTVNWEIVDGGGSVSPQSSTTNSQGRATTTWTLGAGGNQTARATVSGIGSVTFNATAESAIPSPSRSTVDVDPDAIPVAGSSTITVRVRDSGGNPLPGISVSASSSDTDDEITPASATTNAQGNATLSFTSTAGGNKTITAMAGGVTITDTEVITVIRASSTTRITGDTPDPSAPGETIRVTFSVTGNGGRGAPTGNITVFSLLEAAGCTVPVSQGFCEFELTEPGTHSLNATYEGDEQFEDSVAEAVPHVVEP